MSTITLVEQSTPSTPSATRQIVYPKVGGLYAMGSDGVEKQLIDTRSIANVGSVIEMLILVGAM